MATETQFPQPASSLPRPGGGAPAPDRLKAAGGWAINFRFLAWSLVAAVVILAALFVWYRMQLRRHADALLERARTLYDKHEWKAASSSFHQYLGLQPDDEHKKEALLLRAKAYDKMVHGPDQGARATSFYFQALEANPEAHDARLRLAELLFSGARYREAVEQAQQVALALPDEVEAARLVANSRREQLGTSRLQHGAANPSGADEVVKLEDVIKVFEESLKRFPGDVPLSIGLAGLLRRNREALEFSGRHSAVAEADTIIDAMTAKHPGEAEALLARFRYFAAYRLPEAKKTLERVRATVERVKKVSAEESEARKKADRELAAALRELTDLETAADRTLIEAREVAPRDVDVLMLSAVFEADSAERDGLSEAESNAIRDRARQFGKQLIEADPEDRRSYLTNASMHMRWGERDAAIAVLIAGLPKVPESARFQLNRALLPLYLVAGNGDAAEATLRRLEPELKIRGQYMAVADRRRLAEELELAAAQIEILRGRTVAVLPKLKQLAAGVTESENPEETLHEQQRRWRILAGAYAAVGQHDRAAGAYEELIRLNPDPRFKEYRLSAAEQWRISGDVDRAAGHLEAALVGSDLPAAWIALAQVRLEQQLRKVAVESRDFRVVDDALKKARVALEAANQNPSPPALVLLKATSAIARGDREAASAELRKLRDDESLDVAFLPRLATLLQYSGEGDSADKTLERYRAAGGDVALWALTRTEILRLRGESSAAIRLLEETLTQVPESGRGPLLHRLAGLEIESGAMRSVRRRLRELRNANTTDLWVYETAGDLAIMSRDFEDLKDCEEQVAKVDSDGSLARYLRAVRLLETGTNPQEAAASANPICRELEAIRPTWAMTRLLRGRIEERLGRIAAAAESYELALRSGSRNLTNFQWLVATLYRQQRYSDAAAYIRQGGQIASLSGDTLFGMAIPANLRSGRIEDAVRLARSVAELNSEDVLAQLWHGQTLALAEKPAEAEAIFRKVVDELKLGRGDVRAWSALVWFYARQKRQPEARKALADLIANVTLTALDRELVLARGSDLIGDRDEAERHFRQALDDNPKNLKLLEEIGRFYFRFDHDKALDAFRQARAIDPTSLEARRAVAVLTGLRGTDTDLNSAINILDSDEGSTADDDRRLQAALLLIRGGRDNAARAVASFRGIVEAQEQPRPGDRMLLARALEESGQIEEAKEQFESVLAHGETPAFLVLFIEFLIRHGRPDDAEKALARLESADPSNARLVELRVDWLTASHRTAEIEEAVDRALAARVDAAKSDGQRAAIARYAADLLTKAERYDAAEKKLRQVIDIVPLAYEPLALWLVERGRLGDALALCFENAPGDELSHQATVLVRVLTIAAARSLATSPDVVSAETVIASTLKSMAPPGSGTATQPAEGNAKQIEQRTVTLLLETGVLRLMQGRNDEALALYEAALQIDPENAVVLNNRAVVLAEMPGRADDALRDIDRALATMPNSLELLDSKALVLIGVGKFDESRTILERLCQTNRKNSRYRLHMAFALYRLKNNESAREQLDQALKDGLEKEILTPSERRYLSEIAGAGRAAERDDPLRRPAE